GRVDALFASMGPVHQASLSCWWLSDNCGEDCSAGSCVAGAVAAATAGLYFSCGWLFSASGMRVSTAIQFTSQVLPPSSEKACSKRHELAVISNQRLRTRMVRPLNGS